MSVSTFDTIISAFEHNFYEIFQHQVSIFEHDVSHIIKLMSGIQYLCPLTHHKSRPSEENNQAIRDNYAN